MSNGPQRTTTSIGVPAPLGYRAALDGVRAAAIAAVMLTHINVQIGGGGVIGVDIFFVLSGFLITTLLLEERHPGVGWRSASSTAAALSAISPRMSPRLVP